MRNQFKCWLIFFITETAFIISCNTSPSEIENIVSATPNCEPAAPKHQNPADGVCSSVNVRNYVSELSKLENCTVVEGHVHITLIERGVTHEDFEKYSFPELREITDSLLLYRVYGIKTLRNLFPNLAVIRGRQLFTNYAVVAYEMRDLEELGLISLRTISRGGVRLTNSKKLCYTDTVDWTRLGVDPLALDLKSNKEESQCANYCPESCPTTRVAGVAAKRCWTSQHCQQGLECNCGANRTCMSDGTCCHEYCLGGCSGPGPKQCFSCKDVIYNGSCQPQCPPHTYKFFDRRCLTDRECLGMKNKTGYNADTKILQGEKGEPSLCVFKCPENYTMKEDGEMKCVRCQGFCPKVCNGTEVSSIADAQKLRHCSKVYGNLILQIMGGSNVAQELEKNLGNIREVTGYLFIRRSYALITLYFLKSLEIIGGEILTQQSGNSLMVMDNSNLQELFPEEQMKKFRIKKGKVSFHNNRKLCLYKIYDFINHTQLAEQPTEQDISTATNGDLKPCTEHYLSLNMSIIRAHSAVIQYDKVKGDTRHLLMYIVNYREIKGDTTDVDVYQGRDACSDDVWMTSEWYPTDTTNTYEIAVLHNLKPFTFYAVYVQAYTLVSAPHSAMSEVKIFITDPFYPTEPVDLEVSSDDPHELHVKWKPPKHPNGNVTHYKILYQKQDLNIKSFEQRNYCSDPIAVTKQKTKEREEEGEKKLNVTAQCCACPKTKEELEAEARKQEIEVHFENYLHTHVYCKRYDQLPDGILFPSGLNLEGLSNKDFISLIDGENITINTDKSDADFVPYNTNTNPDMVMVNETSAVENRNKSNTTTVIQEVIVYGTEVVLPNLEHFQEYSIEVQACQETLDKPLGEKLCSNRAITAGRTKAAWIMDKINESTVEVEVVANTTGDVIIRWEQPPNPNGLILTFNLFYRRANQENLVPQQICINRQRFQKLSGYRLTGLEPGNWTFQINAVSLAGNSSVTSEKYFIVPQPAGDEDDNRVFISVTVVAILLLVIIVVAVVWVIAKNRFQNNEMTAISPNPNYIPSEHMYIMDGWEVDRDKIKLIKELGQGSFGMVYEGLATGLGDDPDMEIRVAVKTVNDRASFNDRREFLKEATTMKAFDCFHVVKLLGVVSTGQPALVIMELMALGDLKNYLREHRPDELERPGVSPPRLLDILQMAGEIADGMAYLADKKFVHRDLAARNCMVAEDRTVKIGDFGMTRDIYETDYYRKGGKGMLPVRWMAPESLKDGVFTSMSDVWSYGVVMWEMVTLAAQPYQGLSNDEVVKYISDGNTMEMPDRCPEQMAYLMQRCWAKKPKNRPTFKDIIQYLLPHLSTRFEKVSYFFSDGGGPVGGDGDGSGALGEEGSEVSSSINSLSQEGAAAPRLSLSGKDSGDYQFQNSPHSSRGAASLYDDGIDPEGFMDDTGEGEFYPPSGDLNIEENFEDMDGLDDSDQPFMPEDLQAYVKTRNPALLSPEPSGTDSAVGNSGLIELQPLISKGWGMNPPSPRANSVQNTSGFSSDYIGHQPPTLTNDDKILSGPQSIQQPGAVNLATVAADPVRTGPISDSADGAGAHPWQPARPTSAKAWPSSLANRTLRLPTLNKPPGGGFCRVPLYSSGDRNNYSSRNSQPNSSDIPQATPISSPPHPNVVTMEEGLSPTEETSPSLSARHYSPPPGAVTTSSSEGSKDSSKSSGTHSLINGLTNGHIPLSSVRQRTAPC